MKAEIKKIKVKLENIKQKKIEKAQLKHIIGRRAVFNNDDMISDSPRTRK